MMSLRIATVSALLSFSVMSASAQAGDANSAAGLSAGIQHAKAVVDHALAASGHGAPTGGTAGGQVGGQGNGGQVGGGQVGGGDNGGPGPWIDAMPDLNENDALALPILIQASTSLGQAASNADQSKLAYLGGNIAFGNYRFATSCSMMGISRSQIARGNTAALQFPTGFLAAFGPDLAAVVIELNQLRFSQGCP